MTAPQDLTDERAALPVPTKEEALAAIDGIQRGIYIGDPFRCVRMFIERAALACAAASIPEGWKPIDSAPKDGRTLLLGYFNSHGKWRTLRGQWFSADVIAETWENYECDEGWYETSVECEDDVNAWKTEPTHWMPLPAAPGAAAPLAATPAQAVEEAAATNLKTVQALVRQLMQYAHFCNPDTDAAIEAGVALIEQMKREQEAQPTSEVPAVVDPTDPGHDVEVLRNHVRVLERRVRDLHRERNEAPAAKAVRMLTSKEIDALVRDSAITEDSIRAIIKRAAYKVLEVNGLSLSGAAGVPQAQMCNAFDKGWVLAAGWAKRDDLLADMTSPAYLRARDGLIGVPQPKFDRDTDGELLIDWSPAKGRMLTVSLRADGRLSYAFTWDGEKSHGTAQMPAGVPGAGKTVDGGM